MPKLTPKQATPTGSSLKPLTARIQALTAILAQIQPVPPEWLIGQTGAPTRVSGDSAGMQPLKCESYRELVMAWRKALKWSPGLDFGLSAMLASVASVKYVGEQLWIKIVSPPSTGKTTLLEGVAIATKYVLSKSTIRGFHAGVRGPEGEDVSLLSLLNGMTLATKDGDTLLKAPNLTQILSEARDIYDRKARTHYRNGVSNDYSAVRMTWLLCGTQSLREIDASELGARFIDVIIMDDIDEDFEDDVSWRAANEEATGLMTEADGTDAGDYSPELAYAMQMTGGYVEYLKNNATELLAQIDFPEEALRKCARLGKFIAFMRARPPKDKSNEEDSPREFAARLVKQQTRYAKFQALVLNKKSVDNEVMQRVLKSAMDTSRGLSLKIAEHLSRAEHGMDTNSLAVVTMHTPDTTRRMLYYLRRIHVIELNRDVTVAGSKNKQNLWRLTEKFKALYSEIENT